MELLERSHSLAGLETALASASAGRGCVALVSGEAGIGKTSLVEAFIQRHSKRFRQLWGVCDSLFSPRPLGPLHDIALQTGGSLAALLEEAHNRSAIFLAFLDELRRQPTIAIFEDVHWADESTLDFLRYSGRRVPQTPSLLILTYRDDQLSAQHPLRSVLGDLVATRGAQRISLAPLSEAAVRTLVGARPLDAAGLHNLTGGNPFFITEVLASPTGGIPATVRDAVLARTARLSESAWAVLEAAAVIGQRVESWLLAEVTGAEARAADECIAAGMLLPQGNLLAFRHALARQTILDTISPLRKLVLHRLALDSLKTNPITAGDLARLAHHAEGSGDHEAVLAYAPAAARRASAAGAHRDAAPLYAAALRFAEFLPPAEHAALLDAYSRECNLTEQQVEAINARRQALKIWQAQGDVRKQGAVLASMVVMLRNNGENREAEAASRQALEMLEKLPVGVELALAYRVQATLRLSNRDIIPAIQWGEKAAALARNFDDQENQIMAHNAIGSAWLFLDYPYGCAYLEKQVAQARQAGQERYVANLLAYLGASSVELFQLRPALGYLMQGIEFTADRSLDIFRRFSQAWQALAFFYLGRWDEANELTQTLLLNASFPAISRIIALAATGWLQVCQGQAGGNAFLDQALDLARQAGTLQFLGLVHIARAEAAWLAGDPENTRREAAAVYDLAASKRHPWYSGALLYWRWRSGERIEPPDWIAAPYRQQIQGDWRSAAQLWEQFGCPYQQAGALADGDEAARIAALAIFERLGAIPAAEALRKTLREQGASGLPQKPRSATRGNPFGLTSRQVEILGLLIEDLTNAQIAQRLHISAKTVDHHVSAVLAQLDVHTRAEAAARAREHPHFAQK